MSIKGRKMKEERTLTGGLLGGLAEFLRALEELAKTGAEVRREGEFEKGMVHTRYRYSVRHLAPHPGVGVRPSLSHRGSFQVAEPKPRTIKAEAEPREPLIDIFDRGDHLSVIASLPSVREEDLKFKIANNVLKITANTAGCRIERDISIPAGSEVNRILGASFKNGILEIKLGKRKRKPKASNLERKGKKRAKAGVKRG
jgi:HSP20 family molecular chaperone IbpA